MNYFLKYYYNSGIIGELILGLIVGILIGYIYEFIMFRVGKAFNKSKIVISKYKLHHSLYGLLFTILGLGTHSVLIISLGVGIVMQHTISGDGFVFITKDNEESK